MKSSTMTFQDYNILVQIGEGTAYFCARDMGHALGYTGGIPLQKSDSRRRIGGGGLSYIPIDTATSVLSRATGPKATLAAKLIKQINEEYSKYLPAPEAAPIIPPQESSYGTLHKSNDLEAEYFVQKAQLLGMESQIAELSVLVCKQRNKVAEAEAMLRQTRNQNIRQISGRVVNE